MAEVKEHKGLTRAIAGSLVMAAFVVAPLQSANADGHLIKASANQKKSSVISIQSAASRGDAKAMYQLAMLNIEGTIPDADYDLGVRLLKRSAAKGNKDAQRMYAFMDNAFSGEGC